MTSEEPTGPLSQRDSGITIVHLGQLSDLAGHLTELAWGQGLWALVQPGYQASQDWVGSKRIIILAELERYIWPSVTEDKWNEFRKMMQAAESILWVTHGGLMSGENPQASLVNGFFQCLDINPNIRAAFMDFEKSSPRDGDMAWNILHREKLIPTDAGKKFRQHRGKRAIPRLVADES